MISNDELRPARLMHAPAKRTQRSLAAQQIGRSRGTERNQHLRPNHVDLPEEELQTGIGLNRLRSPVTRRTAFDDVSDVDILALQSHRRDHVIEQLSRPAHERPPLRVLIRAWPLADKHQPRIRITLTEN